MAKQENPKDFKPAVILVDGRCLSPSCCGQLMEEDGDCGQGCCDDYKCAKCGYTTRVEWPD